MTPETLAQIKGNLFHGCHDFISDWQTIPWHRSGRVIDTMQFNSSQALAIEVFGTLGGLPQAERDQAIGTIAGRLRLEVTGPWKVKVEWIDSANKLRETGAKTQVDAVLSSPKVVIFVEAKFMEPDGGSCSQCWRITTGGNKGKVQCNGSYELQTNPVNSVAAKCALSGKGIRYWELAEQVMKVSADEACYRPCPFAGSSYQWMRNLSLCFEEAKTGRKQAGFLVVYADAEHLPMARKVNSPAWVQLRSGVRTDKIAFDAVSYQQLIQDAVASQQDTLVSGKLLRELHRWVQNKIDRTS